MGEKTYDFDPSTIKWGISSVTEGDVLTYRTRGLPWAAVSAIVKSGCYRVDPQGVCLLHSVDGWWHNPDRDEWVRYKHFDTTRCAPHPNPDPVMAAWIARELVRAARRS